MTWVAVVCRMFDSLAAMCADCNAVLQKTIEKVKEMLFSLRSFVRFIFPIFCNYSSSRNETHPFAMFQLKVIINDELTIYRHFHSMWIHGQFKENANTKNRKNSPLMRFSVIKMQNNNKFTATSSIEVSSFENAKRQFHSHFQYQHMCASPWHSKVNNLEKEFLWVSEQKSTTRKSHTNAVLPSNYCILHAVKSVQYFKNLVKLNKIPFGIVIIGAIYWIWWDLVEKKSFSCLSFL